MVPVRILSTLEARNQGQSALYGRNLPGVERWLREDSGEDAKTLDDSNDSAPKGSEASAAKSKGSKPSVDEIRKRAYEVFQARHGGPGK